MKKILFTLAILVLCNLSANAYTYQWNVPGDNYRVSRPNTGNNYSSIGKKDLFRPATINGSEAEYHQRIIDGNNPKKQLYRRHRHDR